MPLLPTTTIGSFPQTGELRTARADLRAGRIDAAGYEERVKAEIGEVISFQETAGLDVFVHGEAERNDMVQYFAEQLTGYLATQHGWVQSLRHSLPPRPEHGGGRAVGVGPEALGRDRLQTGAEQFGGLKTRGRPETRSSLESLVHAARTVREELSPS